jgi:hypothetical protein
VVTSDRALLAAPNQRSDERTPSFFVAKAISERTRDHVLLVDYKKYAAQRNEIVHKTGEPVDTIARAFIEMAEEMKARFKRAARNM